MRQQCRWVGLVAILAAALMGPTATDARSSEATLPPPTLSSTDLHVGDVVNVSGTGCVRPETGSGEGLTAAVYREWNGRSTYRTNVADFPVAADGTYSGQWKIDQVLPNGQLLAFVSCQSGVFQGGSYTEIALTSVGVTGTSPQLPDLMVGPGATVPFPYPCPGDGYGVNIDLVDGPGLDPDPFIGAVGQTMHVAIPDDLPVGSHEAIVSCQSEGGTYAYFNLRLVVTQPDPPSPPPAVPQQSTSNYTG